MSMNTLPSREQLKRAIEHLWRGGGTATLIVDVCRQEQATTAEAVTLAERLADRATNGTSYISREVVQENLEMVRAVAARASSKKDLQEPEFDPSLCVFGDGVGCPNCGEVHGDPVPIADAKPMLDWAERRAIDERPAEVASSSWEEDVAELRRFTRIRGVCDGVGKGWVLVDGKEICPECGEPREDRVYEGRPEASVTRLWRR